MSLTKRILCTLANFWQHPRAEDVQKINASKIVNPLNGAKLSSSGVTWFQIIFALRNGNSKCSGARNRPRCFTVLYITHKCPIYNQIQNALLVVLTWRLERSNPVWRCFITWVRHRAFICFILTLFFARNYDTIVGFSLST